MVEPKKPIDLYTLICEAQVKVHNEMERLADDAWEDQVTAWKKIPRLFRWMFRISYPLRVDVDLEDTEYCWSARLIDNDNRALDKLRERVLNDLDQPLIQLTEQEWALIRLWTKLNKN